MNCPTCGAGIESGQKFCIQCGANVTSLTLPLPPAGPLPAEPEPATPHEPTKPPEPAKPVAPPTVAIEPTPAPKAAAPPTVAAPLAPFASLAPPPDGFAIVEQTVALQSPFAAPSDKPELFDGAATWTGGWEAQPRQADLLTGNQAPVQAGPRTEATPYHAPPIVDVLNIPGRGSSVLAALAGLAGVALVIGCFFPVLTIETDAPIPEVGKYKVNDFIPLGTNVLIGFVFAAVCLVAGGLLATMGKRIAAGLAAGAALTVIPVAVTIWGIVDFQSKVGEDSAFAAVAAGAGGTFYRAKQDIGLYVILGAAVVGVIALIVSIVQSGNDGRPGLNLVISVAGALAAVITAIGQLIPGTGHSFGDNFDTSLGTHAIVFGRLGLLAAVAIGGVVGFLRSNRWGVGLALGASSIWVWQWLSSIATLGDMPTPPGFFSLGSDLKPNPVTTIGIILVLVLALAALVTAPKPRNDAVLAQP
ncbi:MAG: hypothetical protein JWM34_1315 [Ilumatobacteraceae bacterium]|nr:hypothetical protein [Ilumatobacteraceae bacterium]